MRKQLGKHDRQEGAIKRTEAQLEIYEQKLVDDKGNKDLKKNIERAKTTIENTKKNMKNNFECYDHMKSIQRKNLRRQGAIERIELTVEEYEKILPAERELLKLARKEKDIPPNVIPMLEKKIKHFEEKLEKAKQTLDNTKANLKG